MAGGRGTGGDFTPIEGLADALGGAVGVARRGRLGLDRAHLPDRPDRQDGVAAALRRQRRLSGAIQHRAGMQTSRPSSRSNKDEEAPIFVAGRRRGRRGRQQETQAQGLTQVAPPPASGPVTEPGHRGDPSPDPCVHNPDSVRPRSPDGVARALLIWGLSDAVRDPGPPLGPRRPGAAGDGRWQVVVICAAGGLTSGVADAARPRQSHDPRTPSVSTRCSTTTSARRRPRHPGWLGRPLGVVSPAFGAPLGQRRC